MIASLDRPTAAPAATPTLGRARRVPHVSVCICTYRRPELLRRLLTALADQRTHGRFTYSIVVADNDAEQSGRDAVTAFAVGTPLQTIYCCEPRRNIALTRNRAIAQSDSEFIAFIDDDEFPVPDWLRLMIEACELYRADGVLGPVRPHFDAPPPAWLIRGRFCERAEHRTGSRMAWGNSRTGNVAFRRSILRGVVEPFRREFGAGGEDVDFFRRMAQRGLTFVWCNEAIAYEVVPPSRWTRAYYLRRALLRGQSNAKVREGRAVSLLKSLLAAPAYSLALLPSLVFGAHTFMHVAIRGCDHAGRLLGSVGIQAVKERPM